MLYEEACGIIASLVIYHKRKMGTIAWCGAFIQGRRWINLQILFIVKNGFNWCRIMIDVNVLISTRLYAWQMGKICLGLLLALSAIGCSSEAERVSITIDRGNEIVVGLEEFYKEHSEYPKELSELCPNYIDTIRNPMWGTKTWSYTSGNHRFVLQVNESRNTGNGQARWLRYFTKDGGWQFGD